LTAHTTVELDPPTTLLGQLQRGLGRGQLTPRRTKAGASELVHCVTHDPRWDRQVEERAGYYAQLAVLLVVEVDSFAAAVRAGDPERGDGSLASDVLMEMALRGRADALSALRAELRHEGWLLALESLANGEERHGRSLIGDDDLRVVAGRDAASLRSAVRTQGALPWCRWAERASALASFLAPDSAAPGRPPLRALDPQMSTEDLLAIDDPGQWSRVAELLTPRTDAGSVALMLDAARSGARTAQLAACQVLGRQSRQDLLDEFRAMWADPGFDRRRMAPVLRYLEALPPEVTLPHAREWQTREGAAATASDAILARHAEPEDRAPIETSLSSALAEQAMYRACSMVEALGVIGDDRSTDILVAAFERSPYSWIRHRVLDALAGCDSDALDALATEALWDCDLKAREVGATSSPETPACRGRLREIERDPLEEREVRDAAAHRLANSPSLNP